jgi:Tfp pilus assembly protein PilF
MGPSSAELKPRSPSKVSAKAVARLSQKQVDAVIDSMIERSDFYWHKGDYDSIAWVDEMVVRLDPTDVTTWGNLAWIWWAGMNNDAKAEGVLKRGLAANPNRYEMYEEYGLFCFRLKRYAEARDLMAKAVRFSDAPAITWNQYAQSIERAGDAAAAARVWTSMLKRFPKFPLSQVNLDRQKRKGLTN